MEHIKNNPRRFTLVDDPYENGRICYKFNFMDMHDMHWICREKSFLFISYSTIYFDKPE